LQVLTMVEAARRASVCRRSLERYISLGEGPAVIRLSPRRVGIADSDLEAWLLKRRRPARGEVAERGGT
jgi:predicted DNA-binding transcriptional regulator AlpA